MIGFLIDEDLPRSTAKALRNVGHVAFDGRDMGLRGKDDEEVFAYAQSHQLTLITADLGFANLLRFPLGTHAGIVVLRVPNEVSPTSLNRVLTAAITSLGDDELSGALLIVELGRLRIRRPGQSNERPRLVP